eukprot:gnl/MRDRNA2_/MRDRNA2_89970_c0_seq1.p1 gnl/MRDRNA2_/MRDRNA2_89970_c0~~gnl/MRDRNA2_/MRDRNA2_89970_c0_seq1.p1  ORF type:complete len:547 (-),score=169.55 gnl/MRDRNA2_/MRDRNA2_89970_c0_seq1:173-1753(-)
MPPKHEVLVRELQAKCDAQAQETRKKESEAADQKAAVEKLEKSKTQMEEKLKERHSLMEKFKQEIAEAQKTLEADHGDLDAECEKAGKETQELVQSAEKIREEIEKIKKQRADAKKASQEKVENLEKQIKDAETEAKVLGPEIEKHKEKLQPVKDDCVKKTTSYTKVHEVRASMASKLKQARDEFDGYVLKRQQALDTKEELELEDARGVVEIELLKKQMIRLKELVIEHEKNLPITKEEVVQTTKERDDIVQKTGEVKKAIAEIEDKIVEERKVAAEKRDICQAADQDLDEITAAARRTSTLLKHALQDVEEQNEDLMQCEADVKELRGNLAATRSLLHDARAAQELAEEKEQLVRTRLAQRSDDLVRAARERDALNDFADGYLREIGHTVSMKQDILSGELAKHAQAWTSNRTPVTRLPLAGLSPPSNAGTGESISPRHGALSPQEAGTRELRERMFQHKEPSQLSATQRAALMCLEKPARSPASGTKLKDDSVLGTGRLANSNLVGNLVANAVPTHQQPMTAR